MPNFVKIGGVTRKPLVDLTRNDPVAKPGNEIPVTKTPLTKTEPAPLLSEVEAAVKQMKLGKTAGLDGVPGELIRNAGPSY